MVMHNYLEMARSRQHLAICLSITVFTWRKCLYVPCCYAIVYLFNEGVTHLRCL